MLIRQLLEREGHTVVMASNGREALDHWRSGGFDAIFMDVNMPDMDGLEACRLIRAEEKGHASIPIIALTANALDEDRQRCGESGMDGFLEKPLDNRKLQETLVRLTGASGSIHLVG
jgi:CheY-like chemotaxis protein